MEPAGNPLSIQQDGLQQAGFGLGFGGGAGLDRQQAGDRSDVVLDAVMVTPSWIVFISAQSAALWVLLRSIPPDRSDQAA